MPKYKLVIFDFDGTLCDTYEAIRASVEQAFQNLKKSIPSSDEIDQAIRMGSGIEQALIKLTPGSTFTFRNQLFNQYKQIYTSEGPPKTQLFDGAKAILTQLQKSKIPVAIVSNKEISAIKASLNRFNIDHYISVSVGIDQGIERKPHPMAYEVMIKPKIKNNDLEKRNVLMVGDTTIDLKFARHIGCDACWASYGYGLPEECLLLKPKYIIKSLTELNEIVLMN